MRINQTYTIYSLIILSLLNKIDPNIYLKKKYIIV